MKNRLTEWISNSEYARVHIRTMCCIVMGISVCVIAGHLAEVDVLFSGGLQLGMSAITAVCNILVCSCILLLVKEDKSKQGSSTTHKP